MLATYPGRGNPVMDALHGKISIRQLRVMVEHLPPDNAAARDERGPWGDLERIAHDSNSQIRFLRAEVYNIVRGDKPPITEPELLSTPESTRQEAAEVRPAEVVQTERNFLQSVLNRPNPQ